MRDLIGSSMTSRDPFLLAIRLLGVVFLYHGLMALWPLFLAQWFLRGAPLVMRFAFPDAAAVKRAPAS